MPQQRSSTRASGLFRIESKVRAARHAPLGGEYVVLAADSVIVPTGASAGDPRELFERLAGADPGVWFYHLFEEPWFDQGRTPLTDWLRAGGAERAARLVEECVVEALPLGALRRGLLGRWRQSDLGRRVAHAAGRPEEERREAGREAVAGLVRRLRSGGEAS